MFFNIFCNIYFAKRHFYSNSVQLYHFQVVNFGTIDGKTQECLARLSSLFSGGSGVHGKELKYRIVLDFENMAMTTDKKVNDICHL